eukprot:TRINITY_DN16948_c0_g1_i1.p1 TRINITY_DN16948_c0_g1~~TRINITY_DN16948_c0_g1_i1.p1  ORF type:complete len:285 (-),score=45.86 TRINITY_DN16948_c0_g1_i1:70-849(-)
MNVLIILCACLVDATQGWIFPRLDVHAFSNSVRRLQAPNTQAALQCLAACPDMVAASTAMSSIMSANESNMTSAMKAVCPHMDNLSCMVDNEDCMAIDQEMESVRMAVNQFKMVCSGLPSDFETCASVCLSGPQPTDCASLAAEMAPTGCAKDCSPESKAYLTQMVEMGSSLNCDGGASLQTCLDVKKEFQKQGCCGNPMKAFEMSVPGPNRRLSGDLLEMVEDVLRQAEMEGGPAKASSLAKSIIDTVMEHEAMKNHA